MRNCESASQVIVEISSLLTIVVCTTCGVGAGGNTIVKASHCERDANIYIESDRRRTSLGMMSVLIFNGVVYLIACDWIVGPTFGTVVLLACFAVWRDTFLLWGCATSFSTLARCSLFGHVAGTWHGTRGSSGEIDFGATTSVGVALLARIGLVALLSLFRSVGSCGWRVPPNYVSFLTVNSNRVTSRVSIIFII
jgi:hypothetical protein